MSEVYLNNLHKLCTLSINVCQLSKCKQHGIVIEIRCNFAIVVTSTSITKRQRNLCILNLLTIELNDLEETLYKLAYPHNSKYTNN